MSRIETIGAATLYLGDCRDVLPDLDGIGAVLTDPPYGTGRYASDDDQAVLPVLQRFVGQVPVAAFGYPEILCSIIVALNAVPIEWVCWWPTNTQGAARSQLLPRESEHIAIWSNAFDGSKIVRPRSQDGFTRRIVEMRGANVDLCRDGDVWRDAAPGVKFNSHLRHHVNEKPVSVMSRLVLGLTKTADTIIDPFMGSGTTGIAAMKFSRKFIGVEIEPKYFDIACKRLSDAERQREMFSR